MRESGFYPPGAEFDPNAPWNQSDPDTIEVKTWVTVRLYQESIVGSTNYSVERDEEFGGSDIELHDNNDDILDYYRSQHNSITKLLNELAKYIEGELLSDNITYSRKQELEQMLDDCDGWDEEVTIEDYELT